MKKFYRQIRNILAVVRYRYRNLEERERKEKDIDIFCLVEFYRKEREREEVVSLKEAPSTLRGLSSTLFVEQLWLLYDRERAASKTIIVIVYILSTG